MVRISV